MPISGPRMLEARHLRVSYGAAPVIPGTDLDVAAEAPLARRAVAWPRAGDRVRAFPYHSGSQRARRGGPAGGTERRRGARDRTSRLRAGGGAHRRRGRAAASDVTTAYTKGIL